MDPKPALEKACHTPCVPLWDNYKKCEERVTAKGDGDCSPWYFDYWKCVDKCVRAKGAGSRRHPVRVGVCRSVSLQPVALCAAIGARK